MKARRKAVRKAAFRRYATAPTAARRLRAVSLQLDAEMRGTDRSFRQVPTTDRPCSWCMRPLAEGGRLSFRMVSPRRPRATLCRHCLHPDYTIL